MRYARRIIQGVTLVGFIYLVYKTAYPLSRPSLHEAIRISPLVFIISSLAGRKIAYIPLLAASLLFLTPIFGRFFCGWLCPFGTTLDIAGALTPQITKKPVTFHWAKYALLIALILLAGLGVGFLIFDPISLASTLYGTLVLPIAGALAGKVGARALYDLHGRMLLHGVLISLGILAIFALNIFGRRFWCRNCCPLGALLGFVARFAPFRRWVADSCKQCNMCGDICPTDAIRDEGRETILEECILCLDCVRICPVDAVKLGFRRGGVGHVEISRRAFLGSIAGAVAIFPLFSMIPKRQLLRPPGVASEEELTKKCVRCLACVKVCPTNVIQPTLFESGLDSFMTPHLQMRIGYCEYECNLCTQVCPTGAIQPLSLQEKQSSPIGKAYIDRGRCISWARGLDCFVCEEVCPVPGKAIVIEEYPKGSNRKPFVLYDRCIGCGTCQNKCPVAGEGAIIVLPISQDSRI